MSRKRVADWESGIAKRDGFNSLGSTVELIRVVLVVLITLSFFYPYPSMLLSPHSHSRIVRVVRQPISASKDNDIAIFIAESALTGKAKVTSKSRYEVAFTRRSLER